jgi:hypothetical protein
LHTDCMIHSRPVAHCGCMIYSRPVAHCDCMIYSRPVAHCGCMIYSRPVAHCGCMIHSRPVAHCVCMIFSMTVSHCGCMIHSRPVAHCGCAVPNVGHDAISPARYVATFRTLLKPPPSAKPSRTHCTNTPAIRAGCCLTSSAIKQNGRRVFLDLITCVAVKVDCSANKTAETHKWMNNA